MILATYTLVTNGSFISVRTGRDRPSGNPSTHLSSLSPPPAIAAPGRELPLRRGRRRAPLRPPAPHGAAASAPLPAVRGCAPALGNCPSGRARPARGGSRRAGAEVAGVSPPTRPFSRRASPERRSFGHRAAEPSCRPRSALGEFGGAASPLHPHPSTRRTC